MLGRVSFASAVASVPQVKLLPAPAQNVTEVEPTATTGKKKKKKLSKTERLAKREAAAYKKIYGPKDAHISLISAADLEKFTKSSQSSNLQIKSTPKAKVLCEEDFPSFLPGPSTIVSSTRSISNVTKPVAVLEDEFPALLSTESRKNVNIARHSASTSSVPVVVNNTDDGEHSSIKTETEILLSSPQHSATESYSLQTRLEQESSLAESSAAESPVPLEAVPIGKKKFKKPMLISLDELLSQTKQSDDQPKKLKGKSKLKVLREFKQSPASVIGKAPEKKTVGNLLDSTGPVLINRGKIRETPKKKKLTRLKKAILATRQTRSSASKKSDPPETPKSAAIDKSNTSLSESEDPVKVQDSAAPTDEKSDNLSSDIEADVKLETQFSRHTASTLSSSAAAESFVDDSDLIKLLNTALEEQKQESLPSAVVEADTSIEKDNSDFYGDIDEQLFIRTKSAIHTRKFRSYCNMYVSKELHGHVISLLKELHRFQDRLYHTDPIKYQVKKRFVHGLKNVVSYLQINKVALIIMAPDIEANPEKGGLDEQISKILSQAKEKNVPVIFSGNRFILGKPIFIKTQVSAIAILDRQGADELFRKTLETATELQKKYRSDFYAKADTLKLEN